jgi:hypothetical protein
MAVRADVAACRLRCGDRTGPVALIYFVTKREGLAFRGIFVLTGLFILACGMTHFMGVWTVWHPDYWLDGAAKMFTTVASIGTAFAMWRVMPHALALPSTSQLERTNQLLAAEVTIKIHRGQEPVRHPNQLRQGCGLSR